MDRRRVISGSKNGGWEFNWAIVGGGVGEFRELGEAEALLSSEGENRGGGNGSVESGEGRRREKETVG